MKTVYLIGDSIRQGYDYLVRQQLSEDMHVYYPEENCKFAKYVLRCAGDWISQACDPQGVHAVHWNAGLWDVLYLYGDDVFTPLDEYIETLRRIHRRLQVVCPKAKQIFATSIRVIDKRYDNLDFFRRNEDITRYNEAACELMEELRVPVNDLYAVSMQLSDDEWVDHAHPYSEHGRRTLANAVCQSIKEVL
jgi:hypothetical protein